MQFNKFNFNKTKQRRLSSHNFSSFGKSSCRVAVTPRTLGSPSYPFFHNQVSFSSFSTKAKKGTKIHFRSFFNRRACFDFKKNLKKKFFQLSDKKLTIRTNIRGTKIQYFYGARS
tara:strand:- start:225 stop:569 length:345 start_codon:yes stop_codon:yes gene_type:complete